MKHVFVKLKTPCDELIFLEVRSKHILILMFCIFLDVILVRKSYPETQKTRKRKQNKPSWMKTTATTTELEGGAGEEKKGGSRGKKGASGGECVCVVHWLSCRSFLFEVFSIKPYESSAIYKFCSCFCFRNRHFGK
jgi:hypothetical protein